MNVPTNTQQWPALADNWLQWMAENRLRGCTPESMVETMEEKVRARTT